MADQTILILGGYGNTGKPLARLLLKESHAELIVAGRDLEKARGFAEELNRDFNGQRVRGICADAADLNTLQSAFSGVNLVVVASSTTQYTSQIAATALQAGVDYLDIQYSSSKTRLLRSMADAIEKAGRCFITDGGFHPGLPALLVRYVAPSFDRLVSARVGSVIKENWKGLAVSQSTIYELIDLLNDYEMTTFKDGKWQKISLFSASEYIHMDFGYPFKKQYCAPMMLEEMRALPGLYPSLEATGFYVGSFNWFVDWIIFPLAMVALKLWPSTAKKPVSRWMLWGLVTFSRPPYGTLLKVIATGEKNGQPQASHVTISHPDGYLFTAIPVAACLLQYLDGTIRKPGLHMQALAVEPARFMMDMQRMGIELERKEIL